MSYNGIRLSDEEQEKYINAKSGTGVIDFDRFIMKNFVFKGPKQEIIRLLTYLEATYQRTYTINQIDANLAYTFVCIDDKDLIRDYPMLKATGFVLETDEKEKIVMSGVIFKESGYSYPTEYKRLIPYHMDPDVYTYAYTSKSFCWPIDKSPVTNFGVRYKDYDPNGNTPSKGIYFKYEFPYALDWDDNKYIYVKDNEYYLYDRNESYEINNGVLVAYTGTPKMIGIPSEVKVIGNSAFKGNEVIISVSLPPLNEVGDEAFAGCINLKHIELKKPLKRIGNEAFANCVKLVELEIPNSVNEIGDGAFFKCGIGRVVWPKGLTSIPTGMFRECNNLYEVIIPPEVTEFGRRIFNRSNTVIIYGAVNSPAENYARENNMCFKEYSFD